VDRASDRLSSKEYSQVRQSLSEAGFYSAIDLLGNFAGQTSDLSDWLEGAQINIDKNFRLQYLAGMGLNLRQAESIFDHMLERGLEYPDDLFVGSETRLDELRRIISLRQGRF